MNITDQLAQALEAMVNAMYRYQNDVDDPPTREHRAMMQKADEALSAYRASKEGEVEPYMCPCGFEGSARQILEHGGGCSRWGLKVQKHFASTSEKLREIRQNQPQVTLEEAKEQFEEHRKHEPISTPRRPIRAT